MKRFMQQHYHPADEEMRQTSQLVFNHKRLADYERKRAERHGNGTIVKFPRSCRQIIGADLPTGPEAA
ncbi:MAG: hypothetical protein DIZ77_12620 [endosymbiont of Seepiophila jonesi]|uniref:Uncharacterized protein n=1 Tax=endosymbiont of Lamellibrachia luymesi TaxID=2200907 RepID=A0A370DZR6_9GAMM|nr:MAG: hypothetical protein DIZ77_12620 [endosymbiont of Seepiophila jonesi]RDH92291.1 MAG: hypothetical protein DIZ79_03820 [endosymbiont of Lamellibrachia luymesi]